MSLLEVNDLQVCFGLKKTIQALDSINFTLEAGTRLGIVGESGAGKSLLGFSIMRLLPKNGFIKTGIIKYNDQDLMKLTEEKLRKVRGKNIAMIFQDPMMTLNPVLTIGTQMTECLQAHRKISKQEAMEIAITKLKEVQIPSPVERLKQYPHELSGGMRQRVVIAIALLNQPKLIIADEPTTALDVTIQAEIMNLLKDLCEQHQMSLILITHDLGVVAQMTHQTMVLYSGRIIEFSETKTLINSPKHPYTQGLLKALPNINKPKLKLYQIKGSMPTLDKVPSGCSFHPRCPQILAKCSQERPEVSIVDESEVACWLYENQKNIMN